MRKISDAGFSMKIGDKLAIFKSRQKIDSIRKYTNFLEQESSKFCNYEDITLIFQTFNKDHVLEKVLQPFLKNGCKNIILFVDGCCDQTYEKTKLLLTGSNHIIISVNNLHEVHNYNLALKICHTDYACLLQDDDIYADDLSWLNVGQKILLNNEKIKVLGFNGGEDFISLSEPINDISSLEWWKRDGMSGIGNIYKCKIAQTPCNIDQFKFGYCQTVNRAPQLLKVNFIEEIGGIDQAFRPYQHDDQDYCLKAWKKGYRVGLLKGVNVRRNYGLGGMRLVNNVTTTSRPEHFGKNLKILYERYSVEINSGSLQHQIDALNNEQDVIYP